MEWIENFEQYFNASINMITHVLELLGVVVVLWGAIRAFVIYFVKHDEGIRLSLARSMALGLEFKLGGEILRTVVVRDWNEILIVAAIILLRSALNFLIHWEIGHIRHDNEIIDAQQHAVMGENPSAEPPAPASPPHTQDMQPALSKLMQPNRNKH
ncbi:MAG: DUF1622 domain-containing protein [Christensenellales bacterium]|nr:DUF1622 domain-containing protein [Christensenellales bacterium]